MKEEFLEELKKRNIEISEMKLLLQYLSELDEGEQLGFGLKTDVCSHCKSDIDSVFHFDYKNNLNLFKFHYCENCNESWGNGESLSIFILYDYFAGDGKDIIKIDSDKMFNTKENKSF